MEELYKYGWDQYVQKTNPSINNMAENIARTTSVKGTTFELATVHGIKTAELTGRLLYALEKWEQPKVGDWVKIIGFDNTSIIESVLPRYSELFRKTAGVKSEKQVMVANVDKMVIVQAMDNDFNLNRIERYVVQSQVCEIEPVIILNKLDMVDDAKPFIETINKMQRNIPVYTCSAQTGEGIKEVLRHVFVPANSYVIIGSSGVGKTTLLNRMLNLQRKTLEKSKATGKGRHTTTTRDMFLLNNEAIVIDTPGMREFGIGTDNDSGFDGHFPIIEKFARNCYFKDCRHLHEKGCAVLAALESGNLDAEIYNHYVKLVKEQDHYSTSKQEHNRKGKQMGKMIKEVKAFKNKYKY